MAEYTENYNLKKPAQEDFYNVDDFNNNTDIIDSQLKTLSDGLGSAAQESTVSEIDTKIGETGNTGGSTTAGSVFAKLNKIISDLTTHMGRWTATRAGYIDTINTNASSAKTAAVNAQNYTVTNNTASKTGILSQKESYTHSLLENTNYGLNALNTNVTGAKTAATNAQNYTATNNTASKTGILSQKESYTHSLLENTSYGLNALNTKLTSGISVVKSIQKGFVNSHSYKTGGNVEITINEVNTEKCFLYLHAPTFVSTGAEDSACVTVKEFSSTKITLWVSKQISSSVNVSYHWMLIEFY